MEGADRPVVQVVEEKTDEILYTLRIPGKRFQPWVFALGNYTLRVARESLKPVSDQKIFTGLTASPDRDRPPVHVQF